MKVGKKIPGTDIIIDNPQRLLAEQPNVFTVCA